LVFVICIRQTELRCYTTELQMNDSIMTGSDEEKKSGESIQHLYCVLHTKDNLREQMTKLGVAQTTREKVIALTFGTDDVNTVPDQAAFDHGVSTLMQYVCQSNAMPYSTPKCWTTTHSLQLQPCQ